VRFKSAGCSALMPQWSTV